MFAIGFGFLLFFFPTSTLLEVTVISMLCRKIRPHVIHMLGLWLIIRGFVLLVAINCMAITEMYHPNGGPISTAILCIVLEAISINWLVKQPAFVSIPIKISWLKAFGYSMLANILSFAFGFLLIKIVGQTTYLIR